MRFSTILLAIIICCTVKSYAQTASFITSRDQDCNILKVTLDGSASTGAAPISYYWDFGNGNTISGNDKAIVDVVYVEPGQPTVSLYVIDGTGKKSNVFQKELHILSGPKIDFNVSQASTCTGKQISFTNTTQPGSSPITEYIWNIGNELPVHSQNVNHTFRTEGVFDVTLVAKDANGCNVSLKKEKFVSVKNKFHAYFTTDVNYSCSAPLTSTFKDLTGLGNVKNHTLDYTWNFGDGTSSKETNPTKTYVSKGNYEVRLTILDKTENCASTAYFQNFISVGGKKPKVDIKLEGRSCEKTYLFEMNSSLLPNNIIRTIDFGDGGIFNSTHLNSTRHTYSKPGKYIIKSSFSDITNNNCDYATIDTLTIPSQGEDFSADKLSACSVPFTVNFTPKNIPSATFYEWDFGDGTFSNEPTPSKTYTGKGSFDVKLKAISSNGCVYVVEKKHYIAIAQQQVSFTSDAKRIQEFPKSFSAHPLPDSASLWGGCIPFKVSFKNTSQLINSAKYIWEFGDGEKITSSSPELSHTYLKEGVFSPTLTIVDTNGCSDSFVCKDCVRAGEPPKITIEQQGPDTVCCLYERTFSTNVKDLNKVDLLWYNLDLDDGFNPHLTYAYYKDRQGVWKLEDNTESIYSYSPEGLGLRYGQTNFALPSGNDPDFYFYAYKNGCPFKIEHQNYQHHVLPWGTFSPLPCHLEENLKGGDTLDFNKIDGNWILGKDKSGKDQILSKAVVKFELLSNNGCSMPAVTKSFTADSVGFELNMEAFKKLQQAKLFPKIVIPSCVSKGDEILTTTYLYTHDDANKFYEKEKCLCEEHWPYKIGQPTPPKYSIKNKKGCAPLQVGFSSPSPIQYTFEDGTVINGNQTKSFTKPGKYRFTISNGTCSPSNWVDSIVVYENPKAAFKANKTSFCLNATSAKELGTIELTDDSKGSKLKEWRWNLGDGTTLVKDQGTKISHQYVTVPTDEKRGITIGLTLTDSNGCSSKDSLSVLLRKTNPSFSITRSKGCFDTVRLHPAFSKMGVFTPLNGNFRITHVNNGKSSLFAEANLLNYPKQVLLPQEGTYRISLRIDNDALGSCPSEKDTTITVTKNELNPDFNVIGNTTFSCIPAFVKLEDNTTLSNGNKGKAYSWAITHQKTQVQVKGQGPLPAPFALTDSGYYSVSLSVQDDKGCTKAIKKDSLIFIQELQGKIDSISKSLCPGEPGIFFGSSKNATAFFWDMGDGSVKEGERIKHAYSESGERNISFIVTDSNNCKKSYTTKLLIKPAPKFELGRDTLLCQDQILTLKAPTNPTYTYKWNTGSKASSISVTQSGTIKLSLEDTLHFCPYTDSIHVTFSPIPKVKIDSIPPICRDETIQVTMVGDSIGETFTWMKDGTPIGTGKNISLKADLPHVITAHAISKDNCIGKDEYALPLLERPILKLSDQGVCPGDSTTLIPTITNPSKYFSYTWSFEGTPISKNESKIWVKTPGSYSLYYGKTNCLSGATAQVKHYPIPSTTSNQPTANICEENESIEIDGGNAHSYHWIHSGEIKRYVTVKKIGNYALKIGNEFNCYTMDTVQVVSKCPPKIYVPNAFTPEQEGENKFHTIFGFNIGSFRLLVFNRWGEIIYESQDLKKPWDGFYRGELMPSGVYPWTITYSGNHPDYKEIKQLEGKVTLVR